MSFLTAKSFVFNGKNCHDYNLTIGWMNNSDTDVSTNGLTRELKKSSNTKGVKSNIYTSENTDSITFGFSIVKMNGEEITRTESIKINQWLTASPLPQKLQFNDCDSYQLHYYAVCTQIRDIVSGSRLIGKELRFETNSPYAFTRKSEKIFEITNSKTFYLNNPADTDNGIYYPTITLSTKADSVIIENVTDKKSVTINTINILPDDEGNKIVKLNSENMTVLDKDDNLLPASVLGWDEKYKSYISSGDSHDTSTGDNRASSGDNFITDIYWVRLLQGINKFQVSGSCTFKIECEYPRKAGCL